MFVPVVSLLLLAQAPASNVERLPDGIRLHVANGYLSLHVEADAIVRVTFAGGPDFHGDDMVVVGRKDAALKWSTASTAQTVTLTTAKLRVTVARADGSVTFNDANGRPILAEASGGHRLVAAEVQGEHTSHVQQLWKANDGESLYGLGQRQEGKLDITGYDFDLWQRNTVVEIPMFVSSRGYGILWDNTAPSKFGDIGPFEPLPPTADSITAPVTGDYQFQAYSNGDTKVWLDGALRVDHYKQNWATEYDQFKVRLEAGKRYPLKVTNTGGTTLELRWKKPGAPGTSMWSEVGEGIDYYFIYGPEIDRVIAGYRALTGQASMLPAWAFGFWQSKNKYNTQDEILKTVAEFRRRQIPMDTIVQDWQYWPIDKWGDHQFEASRYPDPDAMITGIHDQHAHFMISVWGKFYPTTNNYKAMDAIHALYPTTAEEHVKDWLNREYSFYDTFSETARTLFWEQVNGALFRRGVDAWWMDATEPDLVQPSPPTLESTRRFIDRTAAGTASRVMSAYPLMNSRAVYEGQRRTAPDQRVFILTRSGFAGIQRYATVTWSGDITSTFQTLRKQITAGLGLSIAGDPYWTTDTGGYTMDRRLAQAKDGDALDEWQELNARWFQFSTFSPILRVHGTDRPREMWNIGDESSAVYRTELAFDRLRYALFPYIYSTAASVTFDGSTMMRPLVMDFRADATARELADEYMFGPAFLVSPITEYKARTRPVYLPAGTDWYDFWTGTRMAGGQTIAAAAPLERLPLYMRAGAIVPVGPEQQYIGEKPDAPVTLYVYAGANGRFSLYEDDGKSYGYERGEFARIPIDWNDATRTLTIGARSGRYPGMPASRTFSIVLVTPQAAAGYGATGGTAITYTGSAISRRLP
jgi:alpha-D-xyloside xylohydrolase